MMGVSTVGGEAPVETHPSDKFLVDAPKPLPDSLLWELLANYYKQMAMDAWSHNYVPMFVTSNSRMAKTYAAAVFSYLVDWYRRPDTDASTPVYLLEIGAGHGRFTFLFIRHLLRTRAQWKAYGLPERPFKYIYSDIAEANIDFCKKHEANQPLIADGWLDFALFDANVTDTTTVYLHCSEKVLPAGVPMILIANYVLDSLLMDAFQMRKVGDEVHFYRGFVSIYSAKEEAKPDDPAVIGRMSLSWEWRRFELPPLNGPGIKSRGDLFDKYFDLSKVSYAAGTLESLLKLEHIQEAASEPTEPDSVQTEAPAYLKQDSGILKVLWEYEKLCRSEPKYSKASIVFPLGACRLLDWFFKFTNRRFFAIIGDKGYRDVEEFRGLRDPHVAIHGTVSFMVNLHAIKTFTEALGGLYTSTPYRDTFQLTFLFSGNEEELYRSTLTHLLRELEDAPPDGLLQWQKYAQEGATSGNVASFKTLVYLIRYSGHDPEILSNFRGQLTKQCVPPFVTARLEYDLQFDLMRVYENWYKLRKAEDLPDTLAFLSMKTGHLDQAIFYFEESLKWCPETAHPATHVNIASCYKALGKLDEAESQARKALQLDPNFTPASDILIQLALTRDKVLVALLGCGGWTRASVLPAVAKDARLRVGAVYALKRSDAERVYNSMSQSMRARTQIYSGQDGLVALLQNQDLRASVVDLHPSVMVSIVPRLWRAGHHVFMKSPLGLNWTAATQLTEKFTLFSLISAPINREKGLELLKEKGALKGAGAAPGGESTESLLETTTAESVASAEPAPGASPQQQGSLEAEAPSNTEAAAVSGGLLTAPLAWVVHSSSRFEEAFAEVAKSLAGLGPVVSLSVQIVLSTGANTTDMDPWLRRPYSTKERLAIEVTKGLVAVQILTSMETEEVSATFMEAIASNQESSRTAVKAGVAGSSPVSKAAEHRKNEEPSGKSESTAAARMLGWFRLRTKGKPQEGLSGNGTSAGASGPVGSFHCLFHPLDTAEEYTIHCLNGSLTMKRVGATWQIDETTGTGSNANVRAMAIPASSLSVSMDLWCKQLHSRTTDAKAVAGSRGEKWTKYTNPSGGLNFDQIPEEIPKELLNELSGLATVHSSVHQAIGDSPLLEGLLASTEHQGATMVFALKAV